MPFLRAALLKPSDSYVAQPITSKSQPQCDKKIADAVCLWLHDDDISTAHELAELGLN